MITGLVNAALVWATGYWTESKRLAAPLWAWLVTVAAMTLGGPGGDIVFGGPGVMAYSALLFAGRRAGPAGWLLWRRGRPAGLTGTSLGSIRSSVFQMVGRADDFAAVAG